MCKGAVVLGVLQQFTIFILVALSFASQASAEELVMPYACSVERGEPRLTAANEISYRVVGRREEQSFVACAASQGGRCETLMVHRFAVECDGVRTSWARVAAAGKALGIALPAELPPGFAPVSALAGRFVFPALTRSVPLLTQVAMQDLSPDSVIEGNDSEPAGSGASWVTTVKADMRPDAQGAALRVAGAVSSLLGLLFAASMFAAGRWRLPVFVQSELPGVARDFKTRIVGTAVVAFAQLKQRARSEYQAWRRSIDSYSDDSVTNGFAIVHARLAETELAVATLPGGLLLREVLQSEIEGVRERTAEASKTMHRRSSEKSAAVIRALLRELERISRIAQGAAHGPARETRDDAELPRSVGEAYHILGINTDVAPAVAKKLVDALRMSWHPDHARNEPDRLRREDRMKQINAAWDMIKARREAA